MDDLFRESQVSFTHPQTGQQFGLLDAVSPLAPMRVATKPAQVSDHADALRAVSSGTTIALEPPDPPASVAMRVGASA